MPRILSLIAVILALMAGPALADRQAKLEAGFQACADNLPHGKKTRDALRGLGFVQIWTNNESTGFTANGHDVLLAINYDKSGQPRGCWGSMQALSQAKAKGLAGWLAGHLMVGKPSAVKAEAPITRLLVGVDQRGRKFGVAVRAHRNFTYFSASVVEFVEFR